jgi:hypothetical protein
MMLRKLIAGALVCTAASLAGCASGDSQATATGGSGGSNATGGSGASTATGGASGGLPQLTVSGNKLQDPSGKTIVLRGSSLIDIGALYVSSDVSTRLGLVAAAGVEGHVVRMPVYPKINYNSGKPYCSPQPYPVGTGPSASCTPSTTGFSASDYVSKILKPAIDYATSQNLYVIIDFHQIDNVTSGTSAADATTFWTDIAPQFASYTNVLYEIFNEPIDTSVPWSTLKPVVQGLINTVRAGAANNIIIVPSNSWDQHTGDAANDPPTGGNLMFTAHIYANNWTSTFQSQVATASAKVPVFISEWGYSNSDSSSFGPGLQTTVDGDGASWTAWVTDNSWAPAMFTDQAITMLSTFGTQVKSWLAATASSDWVQ